MAANKDDAHQLYQLTREMGVMQGQIGGMANVLSNIQNELVRMNSEMDKRHSENTTLIATRHEQNTKLILDHKEDDNNNFAELRRLYWSLIYTGIGGAAVVSVIWAIVQFVVPLMERFMSKHAG